MSDIRSYWCEHAYLPTGTARHVRLRVRDGLIIEVTPKATRKPTDEHLPGMTYPGLANAHSHAFHRALRGRLHDDGGNFWSWREAMYSVSRALTPDLYYELARAVYCEMLVAGYTAVGEFHYVHHRPGGEPYPDPNAMAEALVSAASDAGIRMTLLDTCYLAGGLDGDGHAPVSTEQRRFSDGTLEAYVQRHAGLNELAGPTTCIGTAIHSVRAVPREALRGLAAADLPGPMHAHVSEQPAENVAAQACYGTTPVGLLDESGLLGPHFTAVHATHLSETDIETLADSEANVCFCPTTERDLADGIGPARALLDTGVQLSLGSDQHAVIDPFEEMRALEMHERLTSNERGRLTPAQITDAATRAGYSSLSWPSGGELAKGALADFVTVRLDSIRTTGSLASQAIFAATGADVTDVFVGGERIVEGGYHRSGSVSHALRAALLEVRRYGCITADAVFFPAANDRELIKI